MKRPKVEPIRDPVLFEVDKLDKAANLMSSVKVERQYSEPGLYLGTSAFTAARWQPATKPTQIQCYARKKAAYDPTWPGICGRYLNSMPKISGLHQDVRLLTRAVRIK
jgi:hypothetical protein